MNQTKVYIINLKKDIEKKEYMLDLVKKYFSNYSIFEAVYGKELSTEYTNNLLDFTKMQKYLKRNLTAGEVGCSLSHIKIYEDMINNDTEKALILEDDISFDNNLLEIINNIEKLDLNWDIILLGHHTYFSRDVDTLTSFWSKKHKLSNLYNLRRPSELGYGTYGYLISRNGAIKLVNELEKFYKPIDHYTGNDNYTNLYIITPSIIKINDYLSENHNSMEDRNNLKKSKTLYFILKKVIKDIIRFISKFKFLKVYN